MDELKLINGHGTRRTFEYAEKWGKYLMRSTYKYGGMHLMFIKNVEVDIEILEGEGYAEISTDPPPSPVQSWD
jgi:hypothetical protein